MEAVNFPILLAALLTSLAFFAHSFVGVREALSTRPLTTDKNIQRHWRQSMGVFQLVTVDLLLLSGLLWVLALTDRLSFERELTLGLSGWFLLWGLAWLLQLLFLTRDKKDYLALGQWLLWLLNAALLYCGA